MSFLRDRIIGLLSERQLQTLMYDLGFFDAREIDTAQLRDLFLASDEIEDDVMLGLVSLAVLRKLSHELGLKAGKSRDELEATIIEHSSSDHHVEAETSVDAGASSSSDAVMQEPGQNDAVQHVSTKHRKALDVDGVKVPLDLVGCTKLRLYERGGMWVLASQRSKRPLGRFATEDAAENWLRRFNDMRGLQHRSLVKAAPIKTAKMIKPHKKKQRRKRSTALTSLAENAGLPGWRSRSLDLLDQKWVVSGGGANGTGKRR